MLESIMLGVKYGLTGAVATGAFIVGILLLIPILVLATNIVTSILNIGGGNSE
jgi:hypothetical protein